MSEAAKPWLSDAEVCDLTRRLRPHAQLKQLKALGFGRAIHFRTDGSFIVLRHLVEPVNTTGPGLTLDRLRNVS